MMNNVRKLKHNYKIMNNANIKIALDFLLENSKIGKSDAIEIISFITKIEYSEVLFSQEKVLNKKQFKKIIKISKKLAKGKPLAYILGYKIFRTHKILVNKNTLIPRMETELIVDYVNEFINSQNEKISVLDLCCGSGCIGISIAIENKDKIENVTFSDISKKALNITSKNIENNNLVNCTKVVKSDFLNSIIKQQNKFNILVCNPPYIDLNDVDVDKMTKKHEPKLALFAKDNGLFFYKEAIKNIDKFMDITKNILIVFEIGWKQEKELDVFLKQELGLKYKWKFEKDYFNNLRYLILTK
ncbi:protein-(glutamine-N5) methyltransferase, release factor-specific [Mesoplasma florum]|nr:protein-(glutamine-N5) methyltransferase, release factor-specific [Mesoplasma florum]